MFIRCGRGAFGWSFVVGFASGVGGVLFFCVFPLCCNFCVFVGFQSRVRVNSVKYFKFISTVYWTLCLFWCVSFTGFLNVLTVFEVFVGVHCLALITGLLPVPFCWCPSPCLGGCSCTTELCMGVFCGVWCFESFYWGPCCNMASNILFSLDVILSFIWFPAFVSL